MTVTQKYISGLRGRNEMVRKCDGYLKFEIMAEPGVEGFETFGDLRKKTRNPDVG